MTWDGGVLGGAGWRLEGAPGGVVGVAITCAGGVVGAACSGRPGVERVAAMLDDGDGGMNRVNACHQLIDRVIEPKNESHSLDE